MLIYKNVDKFLITFAEIVVFMPKNIGYLAEPPLIASTKPIKTRNLSNKTEILPLNCHNIKKET